MTENQRRLLAEKVMGWKIRRYYLPLEGTRLWYFKDDALIPELLRSLMRFHDWRPDIDVAQSMMIVDAIGDCLHLKEHGSKGKWAAMFCGLTTEWSHGNTAAKAICNAALKTLEK